MTSLNERHAEFEKLHQSGCFIIPNPWDIGTAKIMAACGAKALATTSAGFAFTIGKPDMGRVSRDEMLAHAQDVVAATPLPVSGDFENGFGDDPDTVAQTVRLSGEIGLSGISIEDTMMVEGNPAYPFELAVERIAAAADAAQALGRPFILCARADGVMNGHYDTEEAIRRIQAFEGAGADLLYVPMPPEMADIKMIVKSVSKPVNALAAGHFTNKNKAGFEAIGVRRISIGSAMARMTHHHIVSAMKQMMGDGSFDGLRPAASGDEIDAMLAQIK